MNDDDNNGHDDKQRCHKKEANNQPERTIMWMPTMTANSNMAMITMTNEQGRQQKQQWQEYKQQWHKEERRQQSARKNDNVNDDN